MAKSTSQKYPVTRFFYYNCMSRDIPLCESKEQAALTGSLLI